MVLEGPSYVARIARRNCSRRFRCTRVAGALRFSLPLTFVPNYLRTANSATGITCVNI
jgi:hypothetical protein